MSILKRYCSLKDGTNAFLPRDTKKERQESNLLGVFNTRLAHSLYSILIDALWLRRGR